MSTLQWSLIILSSFLIGFSKTGIGGFLMPVIPILAAVFGGRESTGIILPLLLTGDLFALYYYKRHGNWQDLKKLLPWALIGLGAGVITGSYINDEQFKTIISICVIICLIILVYSEKKGTALKVPKKTWFYAAIGIAAGFTSMIGNAAGPIFTIYLLAMNFNKKEFMGTTSWFFFIINFTKFPLQVLFWHNITLKTMSITLIMLPVITLGAFTGIKVLKGLNEELFRKIIIVMTAISAVRLLF